MCLHNKDYAQVLHGRGFLANSSMAGLKTAILNVQELMII